ncbi:SAVED domain-containing protein [Sorangium sp. So ce590]|uniref:SAVED domain-containing protein n=1 Tax=Sorangium sp. So ce590 TaxID=3133317 RepID=UPI003F6007EF
MLLCDTHHRLVDKVEIAEHPIKLLRQYKHEHEDRIELLTSIAPDLRTHVVLFQVNIGKQKAQISLDDARRAVLPSRYPAHDVVYIDLTGSSLHESDSSFWDRNLAEMRHQVAARLRWGSNPAHKEHISLFALAPIPLLSAFGRAVGDKMPADVFQLHRDTGSWAWPAAPQRPLDFKVVEHTKGTAETKDAAVSIGISSMVPAAAVSAAMTIDHAFFEMTIAAPALTAVRSAVDVARFGSAWQGLVEQIRQSYGIDCRIHVFPAVPVSIAVQLGRVLLPKLHPPILMYDYDSGQRGFKYTLTL